MVCPKSKIDDNRKENTLRASTVRNFLGKAVPRKGCSTAQYSTLYTMYSVQYEIYNTIYCKPAIGGQTHRADVKTGDRMGLLLVLTMALVSVAVVDSRTVAGPPVSEVGGAPVAALHFYHPGARAGGRGTCGPDTVCPAGSAFSAPRVRPKPWHLCCWDRHQVQALQP